MSNYFKMVNISLLTFYERFNLLISTIRIKLEIGIVFKEMGKVGYSERNLLEKVGELPRSF